MTDKKKTDVPTLEVNPEIEKSTKKTLVIKIDWGLGRNIAMEWAITEVAKKRPVKVIASRPLAFWWNPHIKSIHWLEDRDLFREVIRWNDYIELEPYTDPMFFNDGENWLKVAAKQLWLEKPADPIMFLAEHEKFNYLNGEKPVLFQPFWSTMWVNWADKSYRSFKVGDAQYIADRLAMAWYTLYEVIKQWAQPVLRNCQMCDTPDLRLVLSLCARYPVIWCDSSLHHASKAFWKQAVVMWAGTDAGRFWYDSNINMWEKGMKEYTPMRLPMNSFDFDISNQYSNEFSRERLDKFVDTCLNYLKQWYK